MFSIDKDCNNENIYFYMSERCENMTKSFHALFIKF